MSRESLLERIYETLQQGGIVLLAIFVVGWLCWLLILDRTWIWWRARRWGEDLVQLAGRLSGDEERKHRLDEERERQRQHLERHLSTIGRLAAVAPLMGLLGTVSGMVHTFESIMKFGYGNPVLLAEGISEALITTQAGLLVAFPVVLAYHSLVRKMERVQHQAWVMVLEEVA